MAPVLLVPGILFSQEKNRHSWTLPGGDTVTGTIESAGARGVLVKREDGHTKMVSRQSMTKDDRALLDAWLAGMKTPDDYAKPDQKVVIKTKEGALAYNVTQFAVKPGSLVHLVLENVEELQHNLLVCSKPEENLGQVVAGKAIELGAEGMNKEWIPETDEILVASRMANPHESTHLYFRAPTKEGFYDYVCTFPGHSQVMKGVMVVGDVKIPALPGTIPFTYKLYEGTWTQLPDFDALAPVDEGKVQGMINVDGFKQKNNFGLVYTGQFEAIGAGEYTFRMSSDDGSRLSVNGNPVITIDGIHGPGPMTAGKVKLPKGEHTIKIEYFEKDGGQEFYLSWQGPKGEEKYLTKKRGGGGGGNNNAGIPLYPPAGEAMIYRNFIDGVGTARGIGVGYSEGVHLAYDAQNGRIALMWRGGFIDAKRHWTGRGQGYQLPSGVAVTADPEQQMMAYLSVPDGPWPKDDFVAKPKSRMFSGPEGKPSAYQFMGYELNEKRQPTFLWRYRDVEVHDFPQPTAAGFDRRLILKKKGKETGQLYLRFESNDKLEIAIEGHPSKAGDSDIRVPVEFKNGQAELTVKYSLK